MSTTPSHAVYWHVVYARHPGEPSRPVAAFADPRNAEAVRSAFPETVIVRRRLSSLGRDLEKFARARAKAATTTPTGS